MTEGVEHPNRIILRAQIAKVLLMEPPLPSSQQEREDAAQDAIDDAELVMPFLDKILTINSNLHRLLTARDRQIDEERKANRALRAQANPCANMLPPNAWNTKTVPCELLAGHDGAHRNGSMYWKTHAEMAS